MTTHKTFSGMVRAAKAIIADLNANPFSSFSDMSRRKRRFGAVYDELNAIWTNDAQGQEAAELKYQMIDAWRNATGA